MNPLEREFLQASVELARQREAEKEAQRQRELEAAQKLAAEQELRAEEQALTSRRFRWLAVWLGFLSLYCGRISAIGAQADQPGHRTSPCGKLPGTGGSRDQQPGI